MGGRAILTSVGEISRKIFKKA